MRFVGLLLLAGIASGQDDQVARLASPSATERRAAARELGDMGAAARSAVPALVRALDDRNSLVRGSAMIALGKIGDPVAVEPLARFLRAPDLRTRQVAAASLGRLGDAAVPVMVKTLREDTFTPARVAAAAGLETAGGGAEALRAAFGDPDVRVRVAAARALLPDPAAVEVQYAALESDDRAVVKAAVQALGDKGPRDAATARRVARLLAHADHNLRWVAGRALGRLPVEPVLAELSTALATSTYAARTAIAAALTRAGPAAVPHVVAALKSAPSDISAHAAYAVKGADKELRAALAQLLAGDDLVLVARAARTRVALGDKAPDVLAKLRGGLGAPEPRAALEIGRAVWQLGRDAAAVPALARALGAEDADVRREAAETLAAIGKEARDAAPALEKATKDSDDAVRRAAKRALKLVGK